MSLRVSRENNTFVVEVASEAETRMLGMTLAALIYPGTVIGLVGPLGAGKTLLSRSIAEALGVDPGAIASPTFVLIHEYEGRIPVYHFDTYRLTSPEAFDDLGADEYFDGNGVCLVEWADRVRDRLPENAWWITIGTLDANARSIALALPESARAPFDKALAMIAG